MANYSKPFLLDIVFNKDIKCINDSCSHSDCRYQSNSYVELRRNQALNKNLLCCSDIDDCYKSDLFAFLYMTAYEKCSLGDFIFLMDNSEYFKNKIQSINFRYWNKLERVFVRSIKNSHNLKFVFHVLDKIRVVHESANLRTAKSIRKYNSSYILGLFDLFNACPDTFETKLTEAKEQVFGIDEKFDVLQKGFTDMQKNFSTVAENLTDTTAKLNVMLDRQDIKTTETFNTVKSAFNSIDHSVKRTSDVLCKTVESQNRNIDNSLNSFKEAMGSFKVAAGDFSDLKSSVDEVLENLKLKDPQSVLVTIIQNLKKNWTGLLSSMYLLFNVKGIDNQLAVIASICSLLGINHMLLDKVYDKFKPTAKEQGKRHATNKLFGIVSLALGKHSPLKMFNISNLTALSKEMEAADNVVKIFEDLLEEWGIYDTPSHKAAKLIYDQAARLFTELADYDTTYRLEANKFYKNKYYKSWCKSYKEVVDLKTQNVGLQDSVSRDINLLYNSYNSLSQKIDELRAGDGRRQCPAAFVLLGNSGIGKSEFMVDCVTNLPNRPSLLAEFAEKNRWARSNPHVEDLDFGNWTNWAENKSKDQKYQQGYFGNDSHTVDDAFQGADDADHLNYINYVTCSKFITNQADLKDKGRPYMAKLLILSANQFPRQSKTIKHMEALHRRFRVVEVYKKKGATVPKDGLKDRSYAHLEFYLHESGVDYISNRPPIPVTIDEVVEEMMRAVVMEKVKYESNCGIQSDESPFFEEKPEGFVPPPPPTEPPPPPPTETEPVEVPPQENPPNPFNTNPFYSDLDTSEDELPPKKKFKGKLDYTVPIDPRAFPSTSGEQEKKKDEKESQEGVKSEKESQEEVKSDKEDEEEEKFEDASESFSYRQRFYDFFRAKKKAEDKEKKKEEPKQESQTDNTEKKDEQKEQEEYLKNRTEVLFPVYDPVVPNATAITAEDLDRHLARTTRMEFDWLRSSERDCPNNVVYRGLALLKVKQSGLDFFTFVAQFKSECKWNCLDYVLEHLDYFTPESLSKCRNMWKSARVYCYGDRNLFFIFDGQIFYRHTSLGDDAEDCKAHEEYTAKMKKTFWDRMKDLTKFAGSCLYNLIYYIERGIFHFASVFYKPASLIVDFFFWLFGLKVHEYYDLSIVVKRLVGYFTGPVILCGILYMFTFMNKRFQFFDYVCDNCSTSQLWLWGRARLRMKCSSRCKIGYLYTTHCDDCDLDIKVYDNFVGHVCDCKNRCEWCMHKEVNDFDERDCERLERVLKIVDSSTLTKAYNQLFDANEERKQCDCFVDQICEFCSKSYGTILEHFNKYYQKGKYNPLIVVLKNGIIQKKPLIMSSRRPTDISEISMPSVDERFKEWLSDMNVLKEEYSINVDSLTPDEAKVVANNVKAVSVDSSTTEEDLKKIVPGATEVPEEWEKTKESQEEWIWSKKTEEPKIAVEEGGSSTSDRRKKVRVEGSSSTSDRRKKVRVERFEYPLSFPNFVSSNVHKHNAYTRHCKYLDCVKLDLVEMQGTSKDIVISKANQAYNLTKRPIFVEDVALCVDELGNWPGPYIKDTLKEMTPEKFGRMYAGKSATVTVYVALKVRHDLPPKVFTSKVQGVIVPPRGNKGFGFDSVFMPKNYQETYAEMDFVYLDVDPRYSIMKLIVEQMEMYADEELAITSIVPRVRIVTNFNCKEWATKVCKEKGLTVVDYKQYDNSGFDDFVDLGIKYQDQVSAEDPLLIVSKYLDINGYECSYFNGLDEVRSAAVVADLDKARDYILRCVGSVIEGGNEEMSSDPTINAVSTVLSNQTVEVFNSKGKLHGIAFGKNVLTPFHIGETAFFMRGDRKVDLKLVKALPEVDLSLWSFQHVKSAEAYSLKPLSYVARKEEIVRHVMADGHGVAYLPMSKLHYICHIDFVYDKSFELTRGLVTYEELLSIRGFERIAVPTVNGDCGGFTISCNNKLARKWIGMHIVGTLEKGYSTLITREILEKLGVKFAEKAVEQRSVNVIDCSSKLPIVDVMNLCPIKVDNPRYPSTPQIEYLGQMPYTGMPASGTNLIKHPFYGTFPVTQIPSALSLDQVKDSSTLDKDVYGNPDLLLTQLNKYGHPETVIEDEEKILDGMVEQMTDYTKFKLSGYDMSPLSEEDAISGLSEDIDSEPLDVRTSAGEPWSRLGKTSGKKKGAYLRKIVRDGENRYEFANNPHSLTLKEVIQIKEDLARERVRILSVWKNCLKDETRPVQKVEKGKTRLFVVAPFETIFLFRKYFERFKLAWQKNRLKLPHAVGINPVSSEWLHLANLLLKKGKLMCDADFAQYDGRLRAAFMRAAGKIVIDTINPEDEETRNILETLWEELVETPHLSFNMIHLILHGNPSGNPFTTVLNCFVNFLYHWFAYIKITGNYSLSKFLEEVAIFAFGDDIIYSTNNISRFSFNAVAEIMEQLGQEYTTIDKSGSRSEMKSLKEITFLKRMFRKDCGNVIFAPLDTEAIEQQFNYSLLTENQDLAIIAQVNEALLEAAAHPVEYYEKFTTALKHQVMRKPNLRRYIVSPYFHIDEDRSRLLKRIV
ncbi:hypothetical protein 1 [Beihai sea slater virus 2]|uniref:hypothetical protein 1 n=1 Tax=Beihai sea slater virus 2 TaxID=1922658 RepID=UPI00090C293C|nr:hypothetical protein 1 [Beihai sea slater virus 2]APG76775.1 hypothetical protein 1 [Beihai sea slater virus 2]